MKIILNGKGEECQAGISLAEYIEQRGLNPKATIVTLNGEPVAIDDFSDIKMNENDILEMFTFVGGG